MPDFPRTLLDLFPSAESDEKRALMIGELQKQVRKDFRLEHDPQPTELYHIILKITEDLRHNHEALLELLYRVDLEEKGSSDEELRQYNAEKLASRILKREAQKVVFRLQYAGKL